MRRTVPAVLSPLPSSPTAAQFEGTSGDASQHVTIPLLSNMCSPPSTLSLPSSAQVSREFPGQLVHTTSSQSSLSPSSTGDAIALNAASFTWRGGVGVRESCLSSNGTGADGPGSRRARPRRFTRFENAGGWARADLVLQDININIQEGSLAVVTGRIGAGADALLCNVYSIK